MFSMLTIGGITEASAQAIMHSENVQKNLKFNVTNKTAEVFAQYPNPNSAISSFIDQDNDAYFAADDFQLNEASKISGMDFLGFQQSGNLEDLYTGVSVYIYEDDNGVPLGIPGKIGTPVFSIDLQRGDAKLTVEKIEDVYYSFSINDIEFQAEANKRYWIIFAPKINFTEKFKLEEMFSWLNGTTFNFSDAVNIDRDDFYGVGMTYWISATEMTGGVFGNDLNSLCFALYGDPVLSSSNQNIGNLVEVFPNPSFDNIFIKSQNTSSVKNAIVYDSTGKKVAEGKDNINIRNLQNGIYMLSITLSNDEKIVRKIIKK